MPTVSPVLHEPRPTTAAAFQWRDAGIGAGATLALLLTLVGGIALVRRRRFLVRAHV